MHMQTVMANRMNGMKIGRGAGAPRILKYV